MRTSDLSSFVGRCSIVLGLMSLLSSSLWARDVIRFKDGRELEVVITKEDARQIQFKDAQTGASQKKNVDDLERVVYEDASQEYKNMVSALDLGDYKNALGNGVKAKKAMAKKKTKGNWHLSYIDYYLGFSLYKMAEADPKLAPKAVGFLKKAASNHAKTRFGVQATYYLAESLALKKDYKNASAIFEKVAANKARKIWSQKARAAKAKILMLQKKYDDALKVCMAELKAGNFSPDVLMHLTTLLIDKKKDYKQAYGIATKLVCRGDTRLKALVHELRGCAAFKLKKYEEALEDLLKATILYGDAKKGSKNFSARANVYLAGSIKALLSKKSSQYGEWEYKSKLGACLKKMTIADQKLFVSFKL